MKIDCLAEVCYKPLGDQGEDAYAYCIRRDTIHTIAVFDGCGGSGAWKYPEFDNTTGAFVSAQRMAADYLTWFEALSAADVRDPAALATGFLDSSRSALAELKASCAPMGVSGSLVKSFPCTASAAVITEEDSRSVRVTALNAGDSRVYVLTPGNGLVQLTRDDSRGSPDPLDSLRENPPLSNLLNADKPYRINVRQVTVPAPCAVLCATDGVFGFVRSPMDFEHLLLKCVLGSGTMAEFEHCLQEEIMRITGDDSTCLIAWYGWNGSYSGIRQRLRPRFAKLQNMIRAIDSAEDPEEREHMIRSIWESYKKSTVYDEAEGGRQRGEDRSLPADNTLDQPGGRHCRVVQG